MRKIKNKEMFYLTIGLLISAIIVISYKLTENIPELFNNADFYYNLLSQLGLAYMGSYVFYIVQIHIPERRKQKIIFKCLKMPLVRIVKNIEQTISHLRDKTIGEDKALVNLSQKDFEDICSKIDPHDKAPMIFNNGEYATYIQYLNNNVIYVKSYYDQLISYVPIIDTEIIEIIDSIYNASYCYTVTTCNANKIRNTNLGFLAKDMYNYYTQCCRLKEYAVSNGYLIKN